MQEPTSLPPREILDEALSHVLEHDFRTREVRAQLREMVGEMVEEDDARQHVESCRGAAELRTAARALLSSLAWKRCRGAIHSRTGGPYGDPLQFRALLLHDQAIKILARYFGERSVLRWSGALREREDVLQEVLRKLQFGLKPVEEFQRRLKAGTERDATFLRFLQIAINFAAKNALRGTIVERATLPLEPPSGEDGDGPAWDERLPDSHAGPHGAAYRGIRAEERRHAWTRILRQLEHLIRHRRADAAEPSTYAQERIAVKLELLGTLFLEADELDEALDRLAERFESSRKALQKDRQRLEKLLIDLVRRSPDRTLLRYSSSSMGG